MNNLFNIAIRFNANQQVGLGIRTFFDRAEKRAFYRLNGFKQRSQRVNHLRRRFSDFREEQRFTAFQYFLGAERIPFFPHQQADFTRHKFFAGRQFRVEKQRFAERHFKQCTHRHDDKCLLIFNRLLKSFQGGEERDHGRAVFFFPVLKIEGAVFNHRLAFCGCTRHPDGRLQ